MRSPVTVGNSAGWRVLAAIALLSLGAQAGAAAAQGRSTTHSGHRKPAHPVPAGASRHRNGKPLAQHSTRQAGKTATGPTPTPPVRPPRLHPALAYAFNLAKAFKMSGKRVPGR